MDVQLPVKTCDTKTHSLKHTSYAYVLRKSRLRKIVHCIPSVSKNNVVVRALSASAHTAFASTFTYPLVFVEVPAAVYLQYLKRGTLTSLDRAR